MELTIEKAIYLPCVIPLSPCCQNGILFSYVYRQRTIPTEITQLKPPKRLKENVNLLI